MTEKYKNKYRIKSHRMPNWDYSANGAYFLTIVTQNRICNLSKIVNTNGCANVQLTDFGKIVKNELLKSFEIRNELFLTDYIIMPNHIHLIIILENTDIPVDTHDRAYQQQQDNKTEKIKINRPIRQPKSISSFFAGFKSAVNTKIDDFIDENRLKIPKYNRHNHFFQPNYHDHIIRNENEFNRISNYIRNNPQNWANDKLNDENKN